MPAAPATVDSLKQLANDLKDSWRSGNPPDTVGVLRDHPELLVDRSLVVDLAYEEYCLREESGDTPDLESYCRDLPAHRSYVLEVLRGHQMIAAHPELFERIDVGWPCAGSEFAGLTLLRELGRGSFARVFLAREPAMGNRLVVLKVSHAPSGEARTLGPLRHPHVVGVHWTHQENGLFALCMPFVGSATLRDVIEAAFEPDTGPRTGETILAAIHRFAASIPDVPDPNPPVLDGRRPYMEAVVRLFACLARALAHVHASGTTHGDLKPSNVLLGPGGHPYLIDFNLAGGPGDSVIRLGGTLHYMAPERLRMVLRQSHSTGPVDRSDVYSFGVMLLEALTGRRPFHAPESLETSVIAAELLCRRATGPLALPRPLARLIGRCLDEDPRRRPSMAQAEAELTRYVRPPARRAPWLLAAGAMVALGVWAWQPGNPPPAAPRSPATAAEYYSRGMDFLRTGDVAVAMKDFSDANSLQPDGPNTACLAYCHARAGNHVGAAALYELAVRVHGYHPAWVRNNWAFCLTKTGSPAQLQMAVEQARMAVDGDPSLRAARLNRVYTRLLVCLDRPGSPLAEPAQCLEDIEAVLAAGPYTADLYYKAALVSVLASNTDDANSRAVGYLREAIRLGKELDRIQADPILDLRLRTRPDFWNLENAVRGLPPQSAPNIHLVHPSDG